MNSATFYAHVALAILSALAGLFHIVYCCIFFTSGMGLWNALFLIPIGFYGICKYRPGPKFLVYGHLLLLASGSVVLILNSIGLNCTLNRCKMQAWSRPSQDRCLRKFSDTPAMLQGMGRVHSAIHALLILESSGQILMSIAVIWRNVLDFFFAVKDSLNVYYAQMMLGILTLPFGAVHTTYCSHIFYLGTGVWASLLLAFSGFYRNEMLFSKSKKSPSESQVKEDSGGALIPPESALAAEPRVEIVNLKRNFMTHRVIGWLAAFCAISLIFVGVFGAYCWHPALLRFSVNHAAHGYDNSFHNTSKVDVCDAFGSQVYRSCYRSLERMGFWHDALDPEGRRIGKLQQGMSLMLLILGLFALSITLYIEFKEIKENSERKTLPVVV